MKITDVTLTLFAWESIPATIYGHHTARPTGTAISACSRSRPMRAIEGHAFLGTSSNPASLDGPGADPLSEADRWSARTRSTAKRLNRLLWARAAGRRRCARSARSTSRCGTSPARRRDMPIHRLIGTYRDSIPAYASSESTPRPRPMPSRRWHYQATGWAAYKIHPPQRWRDDIKVCEAVRKAVGDDYTVMLDSTWSYDYEEALRVGRAIEEMGFYWYEDPLADQDIYNYVKLKQKLDIPILATEYPIGGLDSYAPWIMRAGHRLSARRRRGQGRHHHADQDRASRRGLPHELRDPPRRQFAEQRRQSARHHGDPEHRVLRGAAARRDAEIRAGAGHRRRPRRPGPRPDRPGPRRRDRFRR